MWTVGGLLQGFTGDKIREWRRVEVVHWGEVDEFEMYFVDGLDVGGKGKRRFKYLSSVNMWV